jgi:multiple antibiotic resistance protein
VDTFFSDTLAAFLPLFVAVNILGILPLFISFSEQMSEQSRRRLAVKAVSTAFVVAIAILFTGEVIFNTLGITVNDLRVGGGLILLVLSTSDLLFSDLRRRAPNDEEEEEDHDIGIVPLGIPLTIGPAAITTIIVSQQQFGYVPTLTALSFNLGLVLAAFIGGPVIMGFLGRNASKAIAKIASLFLAAISVAMIKNGVLGMIAAASS